MRAHEHIFDFTKVKDMDTNVKQGLCYLDPRDNRAFQRIFGDEEVMLGFLNAAYAGKYKMTSIERYADSKLVVLGTEEDPNGVFLLHCKDERGRGHVVEVRNVCKGNFLKKIGDYYMRERMLQEMASCVDAKPGGKDGKPVSVVGIVNKYDSNLKYMWSDADIGDENDNPVKPEFYGVVLYPKLAPESLTECKDSLEQCLCLFNHLAVLESKIDDSDLPAWIAKMAKLAEV